MSIVVFVGPTLEADTCRARLDARYLPPARFGDVYRASVALRPRVIAIIDGYFNQVPSVWHKEILWAISAGIRVFGAASMGALRAAELADFGMQGVGRVFAAYRDGRFAPYADEFDRDDEVAIVHGPPALGYRPLSEALVDIRATLADAARAGVISNTTRDRLVALGRTRFYAERTTQTLIADARTDDGNVEELDALERWLPGGRRSVKHDDAVALLDRLAAGEEATAPPAAFRFEHTTLWQHALDDLERPASRDSPLLDELRLLGPAYFELRDMVLDEAFGGDDPTPGEADDDDHWHREPLSRASIEGLRRIVPRHWLDARMLASLDQAGDLAALQRRAQDKAQRLTGPRPRAAELDEVERLQLMDWYFAQRLNREMPVDIDAYADALGCERTEAFHELVWREYLYAHPGD